MSNPESQAAGFDDVETMEGIAIVGLAGRFPGARNAGEFWHNLVAGRDCITRFTDEQLAAAGYDAGKLRAVPGFVGARGLVDRPEWFDRSFFGIPPKEAEVMDPQHRVFLEIAWDALEDAACDPSLFPGLIGVFAGMSNNTYFPFFVARRRDLLDAVGIVNAVIANEKDFLTTRLAYKLNLRGPALNVQTACSSSLVAVCVACQNLRDHQCDVALAGGVSLTFPQDRGYFYQEGGMTSATGECRPFDSRADGTVFSSGAGVVVLKRMADAVADGDQIYTVIKGHALNNDGAQKVSFAAPSVSGHTEVIALAQAVAGISPDTISYIEAHGTATPLGDPIEIAGLSEVFRASTQQKQFCAVGSVKGNIGHCDASSGVASLIKAALAFRHEQLPPSLHCESPNPALHLEDSPFFLNTTLRPWPRTSVPRRAGVSSFGVGGTNAHVVLEECPALPCTAHRRTAEVLVLSAKTAGALAARAEDLAAHLDRNPHQSLADVAFTLQSGRQLFQHRRVVVAQTHADAATALRAAPKLTRVETRSDTPVAFLFPGQGAQYPGMGAALYKSEPVFRQAIDACTEILRPLLGADLRDLLFSTEDAAGAELRETRVTQPAIFSVSYALAQLWLSLGISPAAMVGHSVGEFVAATLAGVFTLEDAARLVATRAGLVQALPGGAMLAARLPEAQAAEFLTDSRIAIAAVNSPRLCVFAGPIDAIEPLEATLQERNIPARRLSTSHAFHSPMVESVVEPFEAAVRQVNLRPPKIRIVSSVTGRWLTPEEAVNPQYWAHHLRATVRFADAAGTLLSDAGFAMLEVGPGQTLSQLARQHGAKTVQHELIHSIAEEFPEEESIMTALGKLWLAGAPIQWSKVHQGDIRRRGSLPAYPFERQRYFADLPAGMPLPLATAATDNEPPQEAQDAAFGSMPFASLPFAPQPSADLVTAALPTEVKRSSLDILKEVLSDLSGIDLADAPASTGLLELGFDSLFLSQTAVSLTRKFGIKISLRQLLKELGTLEALAAHIGSALPSVPSAASPPPANLPASGGSPATPAANGAHGPFRPLQPELSSALTGAQQRWLSDFVGKYNARTPGSKRYAQEHRHHFSDPRAVAGFKLAWKEIVYPIVSERSAGAKLWDIDGNEWNDVTLSFGAAMFGHQPSFVVEAIQAQLARGMEIGPTSPIAGEVAGLVCKLTGMERAAFCNTGSEAVTGAIRIARTVTGRQRIVYFRESYHGISDEVLGRPGGQGAVPIAPGIPAEALANAIILDYGDPRSLEIIADSADDIAAVLVEPVQSRRPGLQPREFLHALRALTQKHGIALIFDEIISGFRCHFGGAQAYFGVRADIATYGKVIGGGLPIGVIAGRAEYLDAFDGGPWKFGDDSFPGASITFFAGTFVRHPLALAAARAVLLHLDAQGDAVQESLSQAAGQMVDRINAALRGTPISIQRFSSAWLVQTSPDFAFPGLFFAQLRHRGIHIWENRPCFLSTAHSEKDVEQIVNAFTETARELQAAGFFDHKTNPGESGTATMPSTEAQREVWLLCQQSPTANTTCNVNWTLFLDGPLETGALQQAVQIIVDRHQSLRTAFDKTGESLSVADSLSLSVPLIDLADLAPDVRQQRLAELRQSTASHVFNLEAAPLLAIEMVRLDEQKHALVFNAHHLVCDGWSCDVFLLELAEIYSAQREGRDHSLPAPMAFHQYQQWERALRDTPEFATDAAYWLEKYRTIPSPLDLPGDHARPDRATYRGDSVEVRFPASFPQALQKLGAENGATLFTVLFAGFQSLLFRLSRQPDLVVGVPSAGQNLAGGEHLIGHCVNMLPVRAELHADQTFASLLSQTQSLVLEAFEHQRVTFGWLLQKLVIPRRLGRIPLISCTFNLDPPLSQLRFAGLQHRLEANPRETSQFDIGFNCDIPKDGFRIICNFNTDLFTAETIRRWLELYRMLLESAVANPSANLALLLPDDVLRAQDNAPASVQSASAATRDDVDSKIDSGSGSAAENDEHPAQLIGLLAHSAGRPNPFPAERGIHQLFEAHASSAPGAVAVEDGSRSVTYRELNKRANQLARHLRSIGITRGSNVGVCMERSLDFIVCALAILKAGAAYVPLDPDYPARRLATMLADASALLVLSRQAFMPVLPETAHRVDLDSLELTSRDTLDLDLDTAGDDVAYVMFTSGSTGKPKGAAIPHRGISRLVINTDYVEFSSADTVAHVSNTAFDASTFEIWGALLNGARLSIVSKDALLTPSHLTQLLRDRRVSILFLTTPLFHQLAREVPAGFGGLRYLVVGGDALDPAAARLVLKSAAPPKHLVNGYGPTETTTFAVCHEVTEVAEDSARVPIGKPIANTAIYLLDDHLQPVPERTPGELHIGGPGLARGYVASLQETAARFVETPYGRLYKTGDLAQWLPDGTIDFLGRKDGQIKLRGYRIEPGEIEAAIRKVASIGECKVTTREVSRGERQLIAYFTRNGAPVPSAETLRTELARVLPSYMLPAAFFEVARFPLTANGKLAVDELPLPSRPEPAPLSQNESQNTLHSQLAEIWQEVLDRKPIGIRDDFFELGGHSLLAVRMLATVEERLGVRPALSTLFENATIEHLAASVLADRQRTAAEKPFILLNADGRKTPFFFLHGDFVGGGFFCRGLAHEIGADRPFYAVHPHGLQGDRPPRSISVMAAERLSALRQIQPRGPYLLGGYCNGALVAFEIARLLESEGERVPAVIMFMANGSAYRHRHWQRLSGVVSTLRGDERVERDQRFLHWRRQVAFVGASLRHYGSAARDFFLRPFPEQSRRFAGKVRRIMNRVSHPIAEAPAEMPPLEKQFWDLYRDASESYVPRAFNGKLILLWPKEEPIFGGEGPDYGWSSVSPDVRLVLVPGNHDSSITRAANLSVVGVEMRRALESAGAENEAPQAFPQRS